MSQRPRMSAPPVAMPAIPSTRPVVLRVASTYAPAPPVPVLWRIDTSSVHQYMGAPGRKISESEMGKIVNALKSITIRDLDEMVASVERNYRVYPTQAFHWEEAGDDKQGGGDDCVKWLQLANKDVQTPVRPEARDYTTGRRSTKIMLMTVNKNELEDDTAPTHLRICLQMDRVMGRGGGLTTLIGLDVVLELIEDYSVPLEHGDHNNCRSKGEKLQLDEDATFVVGSEQPHLTPWAFTPQSTINLMTNGVWDMFLDLIHCVYTPGIAHAQARVDETFIKKFVV